jgi:hypothetical protein
MTHLEERFYKKRAYLKLIRKLYSMNGGYLPEGFAMWVENDKIWLYSEKGCVSSPKSYKGMKVVKTNDFCSEDDQ